MRELVRQIKEQHHDAELHAIAKRHLPYQTCLHTFLDTWYREICESIDQLDFLENPFVKRFKEILFTQNFQETWVSLLPPLEDLCFSNTDLQETNILVQTQSRTQESVCPSFKLFLIDYEYAGFVRPAWDLANYVLECILDNNFSEEYPFVRDVPENLMEENEIEKLVEIYSNGF